MPIFSSNSLTSANSNISWDNTNNSLGINTAPAAPLHVVGVNASGYNAIFENLSNNMAYFKMSSTTGRAEFGIDIELFYFQAVGLSSGIKFASDASYSDDLVLKDKSVGIGLATPNAGAVLDVTSTTKGFLPPRMTTAQKNTIAAPTAGLIVYDTTLNKLCVYTTAWETITSI